MNSKPFLFYSISMLTAVNYIWANENPVSANAGNATADNIRTCRMVLKTGNCKQSLPRFYYSPRSGYCFLFKYDGCDGNANNFEYREQCEETCSGVTACPIYDLSQKPNCQIVLTGEDTNLCPIYNFTCPSATTTNEV